MIGLNDSDYYRRRAEQATALAAAARMPAVRRIHRDMAAHYAALAELNSETIEQPMLRMAV